MFKNLSTSFGILIHPSKFIEKDIAIKEGLSFFYKATITPIIIAGIVYILIYLNITQLTSFLGGEDIRSLLGINGIWTGHNLDEITPLLKLITSSYLELLIIAPIGVFISAVFLNFFGSIIAGFKNGYRKTLTASFYSLYTYPTMWLVFVCLSGVTLFGYAGIYSLFHSYATHANLGTIIHHEDLSLQLFSLINLLFALIFCVLQIRVLTTSLSFHQNVSKALALKVAMVLIIIPILFYIILIIL